MSVIHQVSFRLVFFLSFLFYLNLNYDNETRIILEAWCTMTFIRHESSAIEFLSITRIV